MRSKVLYLSAYALWYFLSGMAILFLLLVLLDVNPRALVFPDEQGTIRGPLWHEGAIGEGVVARQTSQGIEESRDNAIVRAVRHVSPAVVSIGIVVQRRYISPYDNDFWNYFYRRGRTYQEFYPKVGTGFIINDEGVIVTNHHVIEGGREVVVTLQDGREIKGEVIGSDQVLDIAVIKIDGRDLPFAPLGDSDELIIGEWAIAIGNPFGSLLRDNQPTVTVGVISAANRQFIGSAEEGRYYQNMIQTDAAINPGNSGGPLVNSQGQVIGVNTFIFTKSGGNIGLGFAIPINTVKRVVQEIVNYGKVRDVWLGFQGKEISTLVARALDLRTTDGVIVTYIENGSPADIAGLQRGDIIKEMDGIPVKGASDARAKIHSLKVGDTLRMKVERDGRMVEINIKALESPS